MRRFLCALLFAASALWSAESHSISVGYGMLNMLWMTSESADAIGKSLGSEDDGDDLDLLSASSFNVAYGYDMFSVLEVGGIFSYSYIADGRDMHSFALMPRAKFNWINRNSFRLYSYLAFGVIFVLGTDQKENSSIHVNNGIWPIIQLSLLGFEVGDDISFFGELGVGQAGMFGAGVKFRL